MKYLTADNSIRIVFAIIACALALSWNANAVSAQEYGSALTIAPTGQVIVKDATVVSVNGNTIVAETTWGSASILFTVHTTGSTRFVPSIGSIEALHAMKPGNSISFSGTLSGSLAAPTVNATVVKDTTLVNDSAEVLGTVSAVDIKAGTFVIESEGQKTIVRVPSSALMSRDGGNASLRSLDIGDSAKAVGSLDSESGLLTAQRITVATMTAPETSEIEAGPTSDESRDEFETAGVISTILNWLKGSRGMLSIR